MTLQRIWLIQFPTNNADFSTASRYGEIITVFDKSDRPSQMPGQMLHKIRRILKDFEPGDYILWAGGDPLGLQLAGIVLQELNIKSYKFLSWDKFEGNYTPVEVKIR